MAFLDLNNVRKGFGQAIAVENFNLEVERGEFVSFLGPSGCGKTTTVRLALGLYTPQRGAINVLGRAPTQFRAADRERIGYIPQQFVLYPNLSVAQNAEFVASLYGMRTAQFQQRLEEMLAFVELGEARDRLGKQLSGGMQRRLMLASALIHDPELLFADEPTAGIDPVLRGKFWAHFRELVDQGRTLFVTTQYVGEAAYCDLVGVMRGGRLLMVDTPEGLRRKALGGEVIKLMVDPPHALDAAQIFQRHPAINDVRRSRSQPGLIYLYVDDSAATLPLIFQVMGEHPDITVQQADKFVPPFDDIFVKLMEQAEETYV